MPTEIAPWERELLLPIALRVLAELVEEHGRRHDVAQCVAEGVDA